MNEPFPLGLEDYNPAAKPRDNHNFLSLGVLCSIEKSFKFCQSLPVAIDNSTELSQPTIIAAIEPHRSICVSKVELGTERRRKFHFSWNVNFIKLVFKRTKEKENYSQNRSNF